MNRLLYLLALGAPLAAQTAFRTTRHAGLPTTFIVDCTHGDIDGDGDLDLVLAGDSMPIRVMLNDGNGLFVDATAGRVTSPASIDCHAVQLADIDGDGDLDLLAANEDLLPNLVYRNNGAGVFTNVSATALPPNTFDTPHQVVADLDADGDPDWLTFEPTGCRYYANNGAGVFTDVSGTRLVGVTGVAGGEWDPAPRVADLDGDGDLDVIAFGPGGLLQNRGGVLSPFAVQLPAQAAAPLTADFDGDGDIDLLGGGRRLFLNQGNATFVAATASGLPTTMLPVITCFDVDRDGDVDLFARNGLWLNNGSGAFSFSAATHTVNANTWRVAADYDGDGDLELPGLPNFLHHVHAPTAPVLGGSYVVELATRPNAPTLAVLFGALGGGSVPLPPYGTFRIDPASALILRVQLLMPPPLLTTLSVPNVPALTGTALHFQAVADDQVLGIVLTNSFRDLVL